MTKRRRVRNERTSEKPVSVSGDLELKVYYGEYAALVASGLVGALPVTTWMTVIALSLGSEGRGRSGGPSSSLEVALLVSVALFVMLIAPWLVPVLVLRARQPRGARIVWDEIGVTEWDGSWRRAHIAWSELEAGRVTWETPRRGRPIIDEALQLIGPPPAAAITVWTEPPRGVPSFRRRLRADASEVAELREAIERRGIALAREPDWLLACDSGRPPHRALTLAGRLGYPLATLGPLLVPTSHALGVTMGVAAALLLAMRALPAVREVRAIRARASGAEGGKGVEGVEGSRGSVGAADSHVESPYRVAGVVPSGPDASPGLDVSPRAGVDEGRALADGSRLRAALAEVVVRAACVVLVVASTVAALLTLR
jgi:hypothetical protein